MEDAHSAILFLEDVKSRHISYFAVFDGHGRLFVMGVGGSTAAAYAGEKMHTLLTQMEEFATGIFNFNHGKRRYKSGLEKRY